MTANTSLVRCAWSQNVDPSYELYHDTEWGVPVRDDAKHFEFLVLEGAQAGLRQRARSATRSVAT